MNNRVNSTRFLNQEELAGQLLELDIKDTTYPQGGIPLLTMGDKIYVDATDSHSIIFGATGSKKTRNFAMPSIGIFARAGESFVVTDPKGELFEKTAREVEQQGYAVYCLNLRDLEQGESWNPLILPYQLYHGGERAKAMEMVNELAVMITGEDCSDESFWTYTTVDVVTGLIYMLFETETAQNCTLENLNKQWNRYTSGRRVFISEMKRRFEGTMIHSKLSSLDNTSDKTVGSIEALVSMALNKIMVNEEMVRYLSRNSINLGKIAEEKSAVYLVVPDENKTYHFVVSLFLEQLYEVLIKKAQVSENNTLKSRMNFLIDEFANIPKLENMDSMITASRSRNIRFHLIIQSMKQLRHKYNEYAEVICSNCNNWIYLYSKEYELLQEISRLCGEVIYDNGIRVPLFSEFDLQHLNKDKGEALVLAGRNYPCIVNLKDIDEYPFAKGVPKKKETKSVQENKAAEQAAEKGQDVESGGIEESLLRRFEGDRFDEKKEEKKVSYESGGLLAVGPEGMIISAGHFNKNGLEESIRRREMFIHSLHGISVHNLAWYTIDEDGVNDCCRRMHDRLEVLYLTDLQAKFSVRKIRDAFRAPEAEGTYQVTVWLERETDNQKILEETLPDYGDSMGEYFAKKKFLAMIRNFSVGDAPFGADLWHKEHGENPGDWVLTKTVAEGKATAYIKRAA